MKPLVAVTLPVAINTERPPTSLEIVNAVGLLSVLMTNAPVLPERKAHYTTPTQPLKMPLMDSVAQSYR